MGEPAENGGREEWVGDDSPVLIHEDPELWVRLRSCDSSPPLPLCSPHDADDRFRHDSGKRDHHTRIDHHRLGLEIAEPQEDDPREHGDRCDDCPEGHRSPSRILPVDQDEPLSIMQEP